MSGRQELRQIRAALRPRRRWRVRPRRQPRRPGPPQSHGLLHTGPGAARQALSQLRAAPAGEVGTAPGLPSAHYRESPREPPRHLLCARRREGSCEQERTPQSIIPSSRSYRDWDSGTQAGGGKVGRCEAPWSPSLRPRWPRTRALRDPLLRRRWGCEEPPGLIVSIGDRPWFR